MTTYSVRYLDAQGRTRTSELLPFDDNKCATDYARIGMVQSPIVEVWRGDDLVVRLFQSDVRPELACDDLSPVAGIRVERHAALDNWINEGGGARIEASGGTFH